MTERDGKAGDPGAVEAAPDIAATTDPWIDPFPRDRDGAPIPPTFSELALHQEILEEAVEICAVFGETRLAPSTMELLVRAIVHADRVLSNRCCRPQ